MAKKEKGYPKVCQNCNKSFIAKRPHAKYCSGPCRMEFWRRTHPYLPPEELKNIKERLGIQE